MVQKKRTKHFAGSQAHNPAISKLAKLLFQILQCLHHLANIGPNGKGITAKAFHKKQKEMDSFVRPAQEVPTSEFRHFFKKLTQNYFDGILAALVSHYQARLDTLRIQIQNMGISASDFQTATQISLRWGRKNFRSKLKSSTLDQFQCVREELYSGHMSILNSAHPKHLPTNLPRQQATLAQESNVATSLSPPPPLLPPPLLPPTPLLPVLSNLGCYF